MNFEVTNKEICVGDIRVIGVASSSVLLIGDTQVVTLSAIRDTPPGTISEEMAPVVPFASIE